MSVGAILMSLSTVIVAANAQLLRRLDLRPAASTRAVLERTPTATRRAELEPVEAH
jgi:Cu2+-exporting ATPase